MKNEISGTKLDFLSWKSLMVLEQAAEEVMSRRMELEDSLIFPMVVSQFGERNPAPPIVALLAQMTITNIYREVVRRYESDRSDPLSEEDVDT